MSYRTPRYRPQVIRRGPRASHEIELPVLEDRSRPPHARHHAKTFVGALAALVALGATLLATPWTAESGEATSPVDALFTAVSATSVTGLVTVDTADHWNLLGEIIILVLIQAGGIGFMVGASIVLQVLRRGQTRLRDALLMQDGAPTLSLREAVVLSRRIIIFTAIVEGVGALLLTIRFAKDLPLHVALWHGVFHSIAAFCNAGFDLQGGFASLQPYNTSVTVNVVIMLLIQAGALSFIVFEDISRKRRWSTLAIDTKLVLIVNAALLATAAIQIMIAEWQGALGDTPVAYRPLSALFQSVAARTAGFATVDFGEAHVVTLFVWVAVMLVGGASGSTAGGVKLTTVGVIGAAVISTLRGRDEPQVFGRRISVQLVFRAMTVVAIMLIVHFLATLLLAATEDLFADGNASFLALMFEAMSALATVGLTTGITPSLSDAGKLLLCGVMFFGRVGPLTAAYALQRRQQAIRYRLPEASVRIG
ncbi:MAG: TrkH family potassium uptake protein [Thermomicrobiales bacterium]